MSCKVITLFSNKGGVGKTFITVNLGTSLALAEKKVLVIDFDLQAGQDMARMINLSPRYAIFDILQKIERAEDPNVIRKFTAYHTSKLEFLPIISNTRQINQITPENVRAFFKQATQIYDYILIDAGRSFNETLISVMDYSNLLFLVATPDILAVYQVRWCIDVLQRLQFPSNVVKLILNRAESRGGVAWQEVRSALTCEIFSQIPSDGRAVGLSLNRGIPCVIDSPKSRVAEVFKKMAGMLQRDDIYVTPSGSKDRSNVKDRFEKPGAFWERFGISQQVLQGGGDKEYSSGEDSYISLKKKIHERLVERLNLDGITLDALSDPHAIQRLKKSSEQVVGNLLVEESGGKITSHEDRMMIVRDIINEALGLGPLEDLLANADVSEIMVNRIDEIYIEKKGKLILTNKRFISEQKMRTIIDRIIAPLGRRIDESTPMVDARLPDGSRVNAIIPPLSLNGPMITIRKFGQERIKVEDLLDEYKSLTKDMSDFLRACVHCRKNMIVSGGTGSGKTTLLNVISEFIPDSERIVTIEDAAELKLRKSHWARLESRPSNLEGKGSVTIRDLFINSLRMRPDRIVVGECRGPEVLDMLQAMNTGHDGSLTTLHANSTRDVVIRMDSMILLSGIELPVRAINEMISSAVDLIVHVSRYSDGTRKISCISEIVGLTEDHQLKFKDVFVFNQMGMDEQGTVLGFFEPTGYIPKCYEDFEKRGLNIDKSIFQKKARD